MSESTRYRATFTMEGRIRFLSHLETVDTMLSALRRAGSTLALSQGMKPKPVIGLALPRPVGTESWGEIADFELVGDRSPDDLALSLAPHLPTGMSLVSVEQLPAGTKPAASRVAGAFWRVWVDVPGEEPPCSQELERAISAFRERDTAPVQRVSPKGTRDVDARAFVDEIHVVDAQEPVLRWYARLTDAGSVKADEVVRALGDTSSRPMRASRSVRESIALRELDRKTVEPALVGADVPDGPAKPWGAC